MRLCAGVMLLALCSSAVGAQVTLTAEQIYQRWSKSIVTVKTPISSGTGFFDDTGRLYTAYHVLRGATTASIVYSDGKEVPVTGVIAVEPDHDVAVLMTGYYEGWETREKGPKLGDFGKLNVGSRVVIIGSPMGLSGSITEGLASAKRTRNGADILQLSAGVSPGSSGSPVFNSSGEVVAMVVSSLEGAQLLNFALSATDLSQTDSVPLRLLESQLPRQSTAPPKGSTGTLLQQSGQAPKRLVELGLVGLADMPDLSILVEGLTEPLKSRLNVGEIASWAERGLDGGPKVITTKSQLADREDDDLATERGLLAYSDRLTRQCYINIMAIIESNGRLTYTVTVEIERSALVRPGFFAPVTVWSRKSMGYASASLEPKVVIRDAVTNLIKQFRQDWQIANR